MSSRENGNNISSTSLVIRKPDQEYSEIDGEIVMLSLKKGEYYTLNQVASEIWRRIESPVKVDDLVNSLLSEYEVEYQQCYNETLLCLKDFWNKALIDISCD